MTCSSARHARASSLNGVGGGPSTAECAPITCDTLARLSDARVRGARGPGAEHIWNLEGNRYSWKINEAVSPISVKCYSVGKLSNTIGASVDTSALRMPYSV